MNNRTQIQTKKNLQIDDGLLFTFDIGNAGAEKKPEKMGAFNRVLLEALDTVFNDLRCEQEVYRLLNEKCGMSKSEYSNNIQVFVLALEDIFGDASLIVESRVMRALFAKVESFTYYPIEDKLDFCDFLEKFRKFVD